jgi:hypothetical protein
VQADTQYMSRTRRPTEEQTQTIPRETLAEIAELAWRETVLLPSHERRTRDEVSPARACAATAQLPIGWRAGDPPLAR